MTSETESLKLLSIFHYVVAGFTALFSCFPFLHIAVGIAMLTGTLDPDNGEQIPTIIPLLFIIMPALFVIFGWTLAVCMVLAGRKLAKRTGRTFCLVIAGVECMLVPFGTILGVFTLVILLKDEVAELFAQPGS